MSASPCGACDPNAPGCDCNAEPDYEAELSHAIAALTRLEAAL